MDRPILPGLPNDLAMLCLAKLPIDAVARVRAVSRAFASALHQCPSLGRLPQDLAAFCKFKDHVNSMTWLFLSSRPDLRSFVVPFIFLTVGDDDPVFPEISSSQVIETGTPLMLVRSMFNFRDYPMPGIDQDRHYGQGPGCLQGFDMWQMKWLDPTANPWGRMPVDRWNFAATHFGEHVYFAGGDDSICSGQPLVQSSAERLCLDTWAWETLPPMHRERPFQPSAFAIGGRLVVVGGESNRLQDPSTQSGEFYDPTTNAWTLVPDMWPYQYFTFGNERPQSVAVVNDVAYAIDEKLQELVQLKMDSPSFTNAKWQRVGQLPRLKGYRNYEWLVPCLFSVQDELWFVFNLPGRDPVVFSCKPHLDNEGLHWEPLLYKFPRSARSIWTLPTGVSI